MKICKWCGCYIARGSECDNCWEMRTRMERSPEIARKILNAVDPEKKEDSLPWISSDGRNFSLGSQYVNHKSWTTHWCGGTR